MTMKLPPPERLSLWRIASFVAFAVVVGLFVLVSSKAGMRGMGLLTLAASGVQLATRRIPYGWEGREPTGHITGVPAVVLSLLLGGLGMAMLVRPELMLVLLGWGDA
jgi:hypothetical protein